MKTGIKETRLICLVILACLMVTLILAGCSSSTPSTSAPQTTAAPSTTAPITTTAPTTVKPSTTTAAPPSTTTAPTTAAPTTTAPATNQVAVKEWNLPTMAVQTGPIAFAGLPFHWASDYAAAEINAAGGIRGVPLKLTHYDSGFPDMAKSAVVAAKAIPGALLINGPMIYPEVVGMSQQVIDAKIANINAADDPMFLDLMKPYGIAQLQSYLKGAVIGGLKWLSLNPNITKVAAIYDATQPEVVQAMKDITPAFAKVNVKVTPVEIVGADQFDFGATVLKALNANCNGFYSFNLDFQTAEIAKELTNRGVKPGAALLSVYASNGPAMFTAGKGYTENSYLWDDFNVTDKSPAFQKFLTDYAKQFTGQVPTESAISGYDAVYAFKIAIEKLGITGDPAKLAAERKMIVDFLYNSPDLPGIENTYTYHYVNGEKIAPYYLVQIKNNAFVNVATMPNVKP
jgi:branched-chain amino acid transport system substrate-binding protein